ncbi:hypothetical protein BN1723_001350 [Verticillium longisporum]|uniref:Uncharacterized protein n=1 Tax=Verticillium longisporum TaxID=100787 RepID=A0A0G4NNP4_VERLO|nr:hypothetical protein BN1723_001350 [Verticillium longisporum]
MFLFTMFFVFWRILQILTLIPTMGMLAWFVHGFSCAMLKASWAFAIMNCIMFFFTSVLACMNGDRLGTSSASHHHDRKSYRDGRYHGSRRSHSHHSHSRRSSHSRRVYV